MHPNIVILAGGVSSRMKNVTAASCQIDHVTREEARSKSKSMLSVGDGSRPFLDYLLYNIEKAGYNNVVIVVGENDNSIAEYYEGNEGKKQFPGLVISYALQKIPDGRVKPLGTADALLVALISKPEWKNQTFAVCNSDNLYSIDVLRLLLSDKHQNVLIDYDRSALEFDQPRIEAFAVIRKNNDSTLSDITEKPAPEDIKKAADSRGRIGVSMNIFKLSYDMIFPFLESVPMHSVRNEKELPVAVKLMSDSHPHSVFTIPVSEHVIDLTNPSDINQVREYLAKEYSIFKQP